MGENIMSYKRTLKTFISGDVDRIEGDYFVIVLDNGETINLPVKKYADDFKPGDRVKVSIWARIRKVEKDSEGTEEVKERVLSLQNSLFDW